MLKTLEGRSSIHNITGCNGLKYIIYNYVENNWTTEQNREKYIIYNNVENNRAIYPCGIPFMNGSNEHLNLIALLEIVHSNN